MIETRLELIGEINARTELSGTLNESVKYVEPVTQEKTVSPTTEEIVLIPDDGYTGLSQVTVEPIPDEYIVPSGKIDITENGTYDVAKVSSANVDVNPPLATKKVTVNGIYNAEDDGVYGYSSVEVETVGIEPETNLMDLAQPTMYENATCEKTETGYKITGIGNYRYVVFTVPLYETFKTCWRTLKVSADLVMSGNNLGSISFFWTTEKPTTIVSGQLIKQLMSFSSVDDTVEIKQPTGTSYKYLSILLYSNVNGSTGSASVSVEYKNLKIMRNNEMTK